MARPTDRTYADQGIPGRVKQSISRTTGQPVTLYYAEQAGIEADHPWVVVCETHQEQGSYPTLRHAEQHIPLGDWCAACMVAPKRTPTVIAYGLPANPQKGRRARRFITVSGNRNIALGKEAYDYLGNPDWIAVQMQGSEVILKAAEEPAKHGQGIHKVTPVSHTSVWIAAITFLADHQIANGKYPPILKGNTVRFTPNRITEEPACEDSYGA